MSEFYDREGHEITMQRWGALLKGDDYRVIAQDRPVEGVLVSTVWLGLDHQFFTSGPPLIFETMVFGGPLDEYQQRYSTEDAARRGHQGVLDGEAGDIGLHGRVEVDGR